MALTEYTITMRCRRLWAARLLLALAQGCLWAGTLCAVWDVSPLRWCVLGKWLGELAVNRALIYEYWTGYRWQRTGRG